MNEYTLRSAIKDLFGHVDAIPASDAIVAAIKRDGIDLNTDTQADARLSAQVAVALHPEHAPRPLTMSPAERLAIVGRLAAIDPQRAVAFRDETPATSAAVDMASKARERDRSTLDARRRELEQTAWSAEKRANELSPALTVEVDALERLADLRGPMAMSAGPAIAGRRARAHALKAEIDGLRKLAEDARTESAKVAELRP